MHRILIESHNEGELHKQVAELLDWVLTPPAFYTTFPSGWGKLTKRTAGRLNASGLKRGMPDILIFPGLGRCVGLELKAYGRVLSEQQLDMHNKLARVGVRVYVCKSVSDVVAALSEADIPFRYVHPDTEHGSKHVITARRGLKY